MSFFVYMLECSDHSFYVGCTDDLDRRIAEHQVGEGALWTKARTPVRLVWSESVQTRDQALVLEHKLKGWNRAKKQALANGDLTTISVLAHRGRTPTASPLALRDADLRSAPQDKRSERKH